MPMKIRYLVLLVLGMGIFLSAPEAQAFSLKADQSVYIPAGETVTGTIYAAAQNLTIDGNVIGDVICAGQNIIINGNVSGDVICAGQGISINGEVGGNVRVAASALNIANKVARNVMVFGATAALGPKSEIGGDVMFAAAGMEARGKIAGEIHGGAAEAVIDGEVGRDVNIAVDENNQDKTIVGKLTLGKNAKIGGNVYYHGKVGAQLVNEGTVAGEVKFLEFKLKKPETRNVAAALFAILALGFFVSLLGGLIVALVLIRIFGRGLLAVTAHMTSKPWPALGWGVVLVAILPVFIVLSLFTVVGIPLAALAGSVWLAVIMLGKIFTALAVGNIIWHRIVKMESRSLYGTAALGTVIIYIVFLIPVVGGVAGFLSVLWGAGGLWLYAREKFSNK